MKHRTVVALIFFSIIVICVMVAFRVHAPEVSVTPRPTPETPSPIVSDLAPMYRDEVQGYAIKIPSEFSIDKEYVYQLAPGRTISGTRFYVPRTLTTGTNLSTDSYISVESIPEAKNCSADLFLDGDHQALVQTENGMTWSVTAASNAGAGNRYEETVYALPATNPCLAVRYFIHYGAIQNYPEDSVREFDKNALLAQFDQIRKTLIVNQ
jgi:hypothetical protein